jgi:hypothetical protein
MKTGKPDRPPTIHLYQTMPIPVQVQEGMPVTATMYVAVATPEYPPYDYLWRVDQAQVTSPREHNAQFTVTSVPRPGGSPGQVDTLTMAHVTVIDMFGQVVDAAAPIHFQRAAQRAQTPSTSPRKQPQQPRYRQPPMTVSPNSPNSPPYVAPPPVSPPPPPLAPRPVRQERRISCIRLLGCLVMAIIMSLVGVGIVGFLIAHQDSGQFFESGQLSANPTQIAAHSCIDGSKSDVTVSLTNTGNADLTWTGSVQKGAESDVSQRAVFPEGGTLSSGATTQVVVHGNYYGTGEANNAFAIIEFDWSSGADNETVTIQEECVGQPASIPSPR